MWDRRMRENSKYVPCATVLLVSLFVFYISLPSGLSISVHLRQKFAFACFPSLSPRVITLLEPMI